ncbi:hypothetical protein GO986_19000 [Deinococcus sp. HMF7620]|uniref:Uncharacterized protein n=1 Tax=Deinococcus arboris TaxID=2682977 RepID=A0A7C9HTU0_9DEIO|nr:hypothetical protein [Deinococcus arboris]MVN88832.1 hypothetical protein [Deinococcus arboris]
MPRFILALLTLLMLATPASALKLIVWDRDLLTKLGDGESSGGRVTLRLVTDYSGPVVVLFAPTEEERTRGGLSALKSRYVGTLDDGQLTLEGGQSLSRLLSGFKLSLGVQPAGQSLSLPGLRNSGNK